MFGIGPMLPALPATDDVERSSKVHKHRKTDSTGAESHELAIMRRPSTVQTETTLVNSSDEYAVRDPDDGARQQHDSALIVDFDLQRSAEQLRNGEISDIDLALFSLWIKAKTDNYNMAKKLVRELALDQGYNVDKIANPRVRKLLQEVHDVRPRHPGHRSSCESQLQETTEDSDMRASSRIRKAASHLTARIDTLPPSLRLKRERAVQEAVRPTEVTNNAIDYPPNTPDRPAPLSVKSRSSQVGNFIQTPNTVSRSVSTPIRTRSKRSLVPSDKEVSNATLRSGDITFHHSSPTVAASNVSNDNVFDDLQEKQKGHSSFFNTTLNMNGVRCYVNPKEYTPGEPDYQVALGQYQLDASDGASETSNETFSDTGCIQKSRNGTSGFYYAPTTGNGSFEALESYIGSEDEDEHSILESASTDSNEESQTQYQFSTQISEPQGVIIQPANTPSEHLATARSHRKAYKFKNIQSAVNFHRPLPLRSYESEATMFPTAGPQTYRSRNRSKSVTSMVNSTRQATQAMHCPLTSASNETYDTNNDAGEGGTKDASSPTKVSEQVDHHIASASQRSSSNFTLSQFPVPPMDSSMDESSMLMPCATSSPGALHQTVSQYAMAVVATPSPDSMYRAITKVNMIALLQRTRSRGERLHVIDWDALSSFERAWRNINEVLLVTIYGRKDIVLDENDVAYVDCVAKEMEDQSEKVETKDWVRCMFEDCK
ncbi:hypothetical protein OPT61_g3222 [Boeremia exigua]|uniref:Uncharacterized protein n=1 Tax=Boeremia exigua TaxID=749465 RepID=A0ACC2IIP3_9PLEO|nr:hypothetical protein OPT61_g3222 [Boeremia exigua]